MMYKDYRSGRAAGLNPLPFDPATNNEPLQFSNSNGPLVTDCPLENGAENSKKRKRPNLPPEGIRNITMDSSQMGMPMSDPNAWATAMNNLGMAPMGMSGQPLMSGSAISLLNTVYVPILAPSSPESLFSSCTYTSKLF